MKKRLAYILLLSLHYSLIFTACRQTPAISQETGGVSLSPLQSFIESRDKSPSWEILDTIKGEGYQTYIIKFISQEWLTEAEVKEPTWWHWLTVNVPDSLQSSTGMLFIGGGNRHRKQPLQAGQSFIQMATQTYSIVADLHNVPNQPLEFVNDTFGPREEDEIISYGWRKFLEGGAKDEDIRWLARLPMTMAAVIAMDVIEAFTKASTSKPVHQFVVAGASKRGWTTWTTGMADDRVVAIAPIVIDMLNVLPSFRHHWKAYGRWAPAVNDYQREGIMEWQGSKEYDRLMGLTEPYSFIDQLTLPKCIINATGDQFFLPDSWQFYWNQLAGEKHLRYVPNSEHSMRETDAWSTLMTFYQMIVEQTPRPDFAWEVKNGTIHIQTNPNFVPQQMTLWQAYNPKARNFQVDSIGRAYEPTPIEIQASGEYQIKIDAPSQGWTAFFVELNFPFKENLPLKWSTGVVVTPDTLPFADFVSKHSMGSRK